MQHALRRRGRGEWMREAATPIYQRRNGLLLNREPSAKRCSSSSISPDISGSVLKPPRGVMTPPRDVVTPPRQVVSSSRGDVSPPLAITKAPRIIVMPPRDFVS